MVYFSSKSVSASWLLGQLDRETITIIVDVRSRLEFNAGHVPGALHRPFWKILFYIHSLSKTPSVVLYCGYGPRAKLAQLLLRGFGISAALLDGHWFNWKRRGFPCEDGM